MRSRSSRPPESTPRHFVERFPDVESEGFRSGAWSVGVPGPEDAVDTLYPSLVHAFARSARSGGRTGITLLGDDPDDPVQHRSYRRLYAQMKTLANALRARGLSAGERVLLVLPTSFEFVLAFFAIQRLGAIPVPAYPPAALDRADRALERVAHIATHAGATWCLTNWAMMPLLGGLASSVPALHTIAPVELFLGGKKGDDFPPESEAGRPSGPLPSTGSIGKLPVQPSDAAFLQYTSGSTGSPKGVHLRHENVLANLHAIGQAMRLTRNDVMVSWCPLYHDMGLIGGLLFPIYWRIDLVLMSPLAFLGQPRRWLEAIGHYKGTISPAPNFGYALCVKRIKEAQRMGLDLSSWRLALNGAEPVNLKTVEEFIHAFSPQGFRPTTMFPVYGLAEASLGVFLPPPGEPIHALKVDRSALADGRAVVSEDLGAMPVVSVGSAVPGHTVKIADADGEELADGEVGHILVRGPSLMVGYYQNRTETDRILCGGWLWTGDLGFVRDRKLYVTGRVKDLLILRGRNYYAEDIERAAEGAHGVRPGGTAAFAVYDEAAATDTVVVVCESAERTELGQAQLRSQVVERVRASCNLEVNDVAIVPPNSLPKTSSGKRQRSRTRELYLAKALVPHRTTRLGLARIVARSGAGFLELLGRRRSAR
jgi:acyl-CoA synthetase (AMP-forming)/AMP-acid ligase II